MNSGEICGRTLILDAEWTSLEDSEPSGDEKKYLISMGLMAMTRVRTRIGIRMEMRKSMKSNLHPFHPNANVPRTPRCGAHLHQKKSHIRPAKTRQNHSSPVETCTTKSRHQETHTRVQETAITTCLACTPASLVSYVGYVSIVRQACESPAAWCKRPITGSKIVTGVSTRRMNSHAT